MCPSYLTVLDWHCWPTEGLKSFYEETRDTGCAIGSPIKISENLGDGIWCEECRKINKYSWLEYLFPEKIPRKCPGIKLGWHK